MGSRAEDTYGICPVDVAGMHVSPEIGEQRNGFSKLIGKAGQAGCIDCTGRGAAKDGKWIFLALAAQSGDCNKNTNLIGGACSAAGQDKGSTR